MEHILVRHMLRHFDDKNIISDKRHGFKKGHSCETQLITTVNNLLASADVGNRVDIAILDFSKAFDMILCGLKIEQNCHILANQFHGDFRSKTFCRDKKK